MRAGQVVCRHQKRPAKQVGWAEPTAVAKAAQGACPRLVDLAGLDPFDIYYTISIFENPIKSANFCKNS